MNWSDNLKSAILCYAVLNRERLAWAGTTIRAVHPFTTRPHRTKGWKRVICVFCSDDIVSLPENSITTKHSTRIKSHIENCGIKYLKNLTDDDRADIAAGLLKNQE